MCVPQPHTYYASKEKQSALLPAFPDIKLLNLADSISRDKVGGWVCMCMCVCICVFGGGECGSVCTCMHIIMTVCVCMCMRVCVYVSVGRHLVEVGGSTSSNCIHT